MATEMEIDENNMETEETNPSPKKQRRFYVKELRDKLKTSDHNAIKEFLELCTENKNQDYALQYIENGGTLQEILHVLNDLEKKNASQATPILQVYNIVLLKILSKKQDMLLICEEACRELLLKHFPIIKSMLSLNSTSKQRKVALKLLSTMTAMSPVIAKEVLIYTVFDASVLEILTNPGMGEGSGVRTSFIHFLLSFLVDDNVETITHFLEKKGLLASIFTGLIYDKSDTVELVLNTIQQKVLEDKQITKTLKMNTFNTHVVKNLVNLYNWKGPQEKKKGNFRKRLTQITVVDPIKKQKVCETVHRFLLVLCTSKHGVIFRDPTLGLSGKVHNSLMLTVLQGLGKPWEHKLASELVTKICIVCPDLVKPVLSEVAQFLDPRVSQKWLNAVRFVKNLIINLSPENLSQYLEKLSLKQIILIIQNFCVPKNIVQTINAQTVSNEYLSIRHEVLDLLHAMCNSVSKYLNFVQNLNYFTESDKIKLKDVTQNYLEQNLPNLNTVINVWKMSITPNELSEDPELPFPQLSKHLSVILDILYEYHLICPHFVEDMKNQVDTLVFLRTIEKLCIDNPELSSEMYIKAINLFLLCDFASFLPTSDLFSYVTPLLLKIYYANKTKSIEDTLFKLFKNTTIFDSCEYEIKIWLYSILELENYNDEIGNLITTAIQLSYTNILEYQKEIINIQSNVTEIKFDIKYLLENLSDNVQESIDKKLMYIQKDLQTILSPLTFGIINSELPKDVRSYFNILFIHLLHSQTDASILFNIIEQNSQKVSKHLLSYFNKWNDCQNLISIKKIYPENILSEASNYLISEEINFDLICEDYQLILLSKMVVFYLTQLSKNELLTNEIQEKCLKTTKLLLLKSKELDCYNNCLDIILKHPFLIKSFSPIHSNFSTQYIIKIIEELTQTQSKIELEHYFDYYRTILLKRIHVMLQKNKKHCKPPKKNKFMEVVYLLDLSSENCNDLIKISTDLPLECMISAENTPSSIIELLNYILNRNLLLHANNNVKPFDDDIVTNLSKILLHLNTYDVELNTENFEISLYSYVQLFPHTVKCFDDNIFKSIVLKPTTKSTANLVMILLKCNPNYFDIIENNLDKIIEQRELIFSILSAVFETQNTFVQKVYEKYEQYIMKIIYKPHKVQKFKPETIVKLINGFMSLETCKEFTSKVQKFEITLHNHFDVVIEIFDKTISNSEEKNKYVTNFLITFMNLIVNSLKRTEKTEHDWNETDRVLKSFTVYLNKILNVYKIDYQEDLSKNAAFQTYSKLSLKYGLLGNATLVEVLVKVSELCTKNEYLSTLFDMAVSHSESLNILLDTTNKVKQHLVHLLLVLCKKQPTVVHKNHIPVWLGAYEGTLSLSDQCLLQLMSIYEDSDIGFHEYKPYLWGKSAVNHYSVRFGVETALWRQPKPSEVLEIFDVEKIKYTIRCFPIKRALSPGFCESDSMVYDPAFYLPLLTQLLALESTIKWYQCKFGALALVIVALASEVKEVRNAACVVLARFHGHLEAAKHGKDRLLYQHFIEALCRATAKQEELQISTIAGVFMSRCALIFNRPDHILYTALTRYIMAKECPDIAHVPEMLELLHSTDVKYMDHRNFILEVMRDGIKSENDLKVMFRSMAYKLLMDMYNSVVLNLEGKRLILEILSATVTLQTGGRVLAKSYGLMSWLFSIIKLLGPNNSDLLSKIIDILHKLISNLEEHRLKNYDFSILLCLVNIVESMKNIKITLEGLVKFVTILYNIYNGNPRMLTKNCLEDLLNISVKYLDCNVCKYYLEYGSDFVEKPKILSENLSEQGVYYLKLLTLRWMEVNMNTN